jgi:uncharacterized membrane protein YdjX (TVP38/TMEM64 family)
MSSALKRFGPIALVLAGLVLALSLGLHRYLSFDALAERQDQLQALLATRPWLVAGGFVAIYVLATATSLPGAIWLTIGGGFLFGPFLGTALSALGATTGATLLFLAASSAFGEGLAARAGGWVSRFEDGFRQNAFTNLLTLRLLPVAPFWGVNLAAAALKVPLGTFILATAIGILPGGFVYALIGNGLGAAIATGAPPNLSLFSQPAIVAPLFGLAALAMLPTVLRLVRGGRTAEAVAIQADAAPKDGGSTDPAATGDAGQDTRPLDARS